MISSSACMYTLPSLRESLDTHMDNLGELDYLLAWACS